MEPCSRQDLLLLATTSASLPLCGGYFVLSAKTVRDENTVDTGQETTNL